RFAKALPAGEVVDTVRAIALGGDAMHKGDLELFKAHFSAQCNLVNMYGATESSSALFFVAGHDTEIDGEVVPLGFPPEDTSVVLVRNGVEQRAHSIVGEIAIKSEHVALGYWNADASTKERFLPDPANPARRVYLTGDLGRVLPSGAVEYVGRKDFQVKIRGFRVGLGEVEAFLAEHPAVKDVVVVANEEVGEEKELVAYYVLADVPERPAPRELREFMLSKVPDYMVPRFLMDISSLPLTARGKIDRASLPKPHQEEPSDEPRARNYERPRSDVERTLARIWEDLLGVKPVGIRDNFFALGGHSMLGFQMFDRVKAEFGVSVPPVALYRGAATVELLAIQVETKRQAQAAAAT
ncbi:MAG TPA: non-ribosomal peptide synthetase, partial [Polyangiaceae bacterium]|nr:non-ribosomal peptide synthetase [Polyangiaceae bacterium]